MEKEKKGPAAAAGIALATALVLLAPLGGFLLWRYVSERPGMRWDLSPDGSAPAGASADAQTAPRQFAAEEKEEPKKKPPVKRAAVPVKPAPKPVVRQAPAPGSIPVGMEKSRLVAMFGRPQMITVEVQDGRTIETFHYLQRDAGMETIVRLSSGKVVSADASVY
jgi:hypothetical protein